MVQKFLVAPIAGVLAIVVSLLLMYRIGKMNRVDQDRRSRQRNSRGAYAFLEQYMTIAVITAVLFVLLAVASIVERQLHSWRSCSLAAGYIAMDNATKQTCARAAKDR